MGVIVHGVRRFAGHQVISFDQAWLLCTGLSPDERDRDEAGRLRWLLEELGYKRRWVAEVGRPKMQHLWAREAWPGDFGANLGRDLKVFVPMG